MKWAVLASKELVGALIGVAGVFWAAPWVARDARQRENRSAAMVLISSLGGMIAVSHSVLKTVPKIGTDADRGRYVAGHLVRYFPGLDPMFAGCSARLMPRHVVLATKLHAVTMTHEIMVAASFPSAGLMWSLNAN